jgi:hypothetical protein
VESSGGAEKPLVNKDVLEKLRNAKKIVLSSFNLTWIINLPNTVAADGDPPLQTMVYLMEPSFNQAELLAKSTNTYESDLHNATAVQKWEVGCGEEEAHTIIDQALKEMRKHNDTQPETLMQRHELLVALRSGTTTAGPAYSENPFAASDAAEASRNPDGPGSTGPDSRIAVEASPDHIGSARVLRFGSTSGGIASNPATAESSQYVPLSTPRTPSTSIAVPSLKRWVGRNERSGHPTRNTTPFSRRSSGLPERAQATLQAGQHPKDRSPAQIPNEAHHRNARGNPSSRT